MKTTKLKPVQVMDLEKECIDLAMSQNAGFAVQKFRLAYGESEGFKNISADAVALNERLNEIMIHARREMRKALVDFTLADEKVCG